MLKVFENFDVNRVGQVQSLLESHGIPTFLKNQFTSSVMGDIPFVEVCPQLFILDERDRDMANRVMAATLGAGPRQPAWTCSACTTHLEGQFDRCWNCGSARDSA